MPRYGGDYTTGRYTRDRGEIGMGYDADYGGGSQWGRGSARSWNDMEGGRGGRSGRYGHFDETWDSAGHGGTGRGHAEGRGSSARFGGYGAQDWGRFGGQASQDWGRFGGQGEQGWGGPGRFGGYGGGWSDRPQSGEWEGRGPRDREMNYGPRRGHDYDENFGDRIRRGWNRLRNEARGWMGRGYDRGW
jgi:hypothetical protein